MGAPLSKTKALGVFIRGSFIPSPHIPLPSSSSSKQWRHRSIGSGSAHSSQQAGQRNFVSSFSLQERQRGGKRKSRIKLKIGFTVLKSPAFSADGIWDRRECRQSRLKTPLSV